MLRLALTGGDGFLGWHVRVLVRALGWPDPVRLDRADLSDPDVLAARLAQVDRVLHLAGVNRGTPAELSAGNARLASAVVAGMDRCPVPPQVVFANSVQAGNGSPYGDGKAAAAAILADAGYDFHDVRLPNLYGEHGRPFYNSVVATFCRVLADGGRPEVLEDRELRLVHATDAAARLVGAPDGGSWDADMPAWRTSVRELAEVLTGYAALYRTGQMPALTDRHRLRLFNTYRSHCFPSHYPIPLPRHADRRGELVEAVKVHAGGGQTFCSTSFPGQTRGEHFHLTKVERFMVVRGSAEISLRRFGGDEVVRFRVSGRKPVAVDMPTMWVHKIVNTGTDELMTLFWANEIFDPANPDTYPEPVEVVPHLAAVPA